MQSIAADDVITRTMGSHPTCFSGDLDQHNPWFIGSCMRSTPISEPTNEPGWC